MKSQAFLIFVVLTGYTSSSVSGQAIPFVISTWSHSWNATVEAWELLQVGQLDAMDVLVQAISVCELTPKGCGASVGYGNKPDESGEVTLDAMVMDGRTMDVGAVGCLRRVKNAVAVARAVLDYTDHTLLTGDLATDFAVSMGFPDESLSTAESDQEWVSWQGDSCQPNFWQSGTDLVPDTTTSCGPYSPGGVPASAGDSRSIEEETHYNPRTRGEPDHDTIATVVIGTDGSVVCGTSTNGLQHKIAGRVGDSPFPGAGSYVENDVGAAVATGNGDIMMRFSPSFYAVNEMSRGATPSQAASSAVQKIVRYYPQFNGAVIAVSNNGDYGAACHGYETFPMTLASPVTGQVIEETIIC